MDVKILSKEVIKPSKQTPHHLRDLKLSLLDQINGAGYIRFSLFYPINGSQRNIPKTLTHLKKSLSKTLTRFYPFSGRMKDSSFIDCNDEGVLFMEARAQYCRLSEFLANPKIEILNEFIPCNPKCKEEKSMPLVALQVTVFDCGGIAIGTCMSHKIIDAATMSAFLNSWAETTRGGGKHEAAGLDFTSGPSLFPARDSKLLSGLFSFAGSLVKEGKFEMRRFLFDVKTLATLKAKAASETVPNPTRVETVTAFIWKRFMAASKAIRGSSNTSIAMHAVNMRRRMEPPLPDHAPGNLCLTATAFCYPQESFEVELPEVTKILKETFMTFTSDTIKKLQGGDGFSLIREKLKELATVYENVNQDTFMFSSWCNQGLYAVDFGWGKPIWGGVSYLGDSVNSQEINSVILIESGCGDGGIEVWMTLDQQQLAVLENDPEFLAFATPNPSILSH